MILIFGMGNPGEQYQNTRHNAGHSVVDFLAGNAVWGGEKRLSAVIAEGMIGHKKIIFAKSLNYMNESGAAVAAVACFFKIKPENILVVHDEIDLKLGTWKLQHNRGAGGHHGVESVIKALGTSAFWRLRVGILPEKKPVDTATFVLKPFLKKEHELFATHLDNLQQVVLNWLQTP